jgi:hypothetical protein
MNVSQYVLSLLDISDHNKKKKYKLLVYVDTVKPVKLATLLQNQQISMTLYMVITP